MACVRSAVIVPLVMCACDDPVPGEIGGVLFQIRTTPQVEDDPADTIDRVVVHYGRVEAKHGDADGNGSTVVLDSQPRTVELFNVDEDTLVAQFEVPVGTVNQLRILDASVTLALRDGSDVVLEESDLPSWEQTGWKVVPEDDEPFEIAVDQLTGVRGLLDLSDRVVHAGNGRWKLKPTLPAEEFDVSPPTVYTGGIYSDQITVLFDAGTSEADVEAINAGIGASITLRPLRTAAWRMKLPTSVTMEEAVDYYSDHREVVAASPALNIPNQALHANDENDNANYGHGRFPDAWETVQGRIGTVGDRRVVVGLVEGGGVDVTHPDLFLNIWLNQGEIPDDLRDDLVDADGDALITFVDLNDAANASFVDDLNGNGRIDGDDLTTEGSSWLDGADGDDAGDFEDDIVGFNFLPEGGSPRVMPNLDKDDPSEHGTLTAGIIGALGDNGIGVAGTTWVVSIVPLIAEVTAYSSTFDSSAELAIPDVTFGEMLKYANTLDLPIVNVSQGYGLLGKGADRKCTTLQPFQHNKGVPDDNFDEAVEVATAWYTDPQFGIVGEDGNLATNTLFVFSAGNNGMNLNDPFIVEVPKSIFQSVAPKRTLIVGNGVHPQTNHVESNFGAPVVDLWAPGTGWESLTLFEGTGSCTGTSCAAPAVAGAAALVLAANDHLLDSPTRGLELHDALVDSARATLDVTKCNDVRGTDRAFLDAAAAVVHP